MKNKHHKLLYIAELPPPFGGVTIKNQLLLEEAFADTDLVIFDLYRFKRKKAAFPALCLELVGLIRQANYIALGTGSNVRLVKLLSIIDKLRGSDFLSHVTVFMMGRTLVDYLAEKPNKIVRFKQCGCIFVESNTLVRKFRELGVTCARYLPNFRKSERARAPRPVGEVVHFVYFAQVRPEKGIGTLAEAASRLNAEGLIDKFDITVYGTVVDGYGEAFEALLADVPNMVYKGVFDAALGDVYAELNSYDSSLSSSWQEGMSGSNIECKFAGIANIVSDAGFNSECVRDGVDGLLVKPRDVGNLVDAMRRVVCDHELLMRLKQASYDNRMKYDVANWKDWVLDVVLGRSLGEEKA